MKKLVSFLTIMALSITPLMADDSEMPSIAETAASLPDGFSTLTLALVRTDLTATLNNKGPFTVFAPTNLAFDQAAEAILGTGNTGQDLVFALDKETLSDILLYHVVPGSLGSPQVLASESLTTANGDDFSIDAGTPAIIDGQNGMAGFVSLDIPAANGIIHVIDSVLLPPTTMEPVSIYETAATNPAFTSLVAAIDKAGLKSFLSYERYNFTVFAPTNAAFDAAAKLALDDESATGVDLVSALSKWQLRRILLNHVAWGELFSEDVLDRSVIYTFAWGRLYVDAENLFISSRNGGGNLIPELIDIDATNGVIHVVDGVLLP